MQSKHVYKEEHTLKLLLLLHQLSDSIHKKKPLQANHSEFGKKVQL